MKLTECPIINVRFKWGKILLTIFAIIFMLSCKDEDELILGTTILQGTWLEEEPEDAIQIVGENHIFIFREDSFFLKINKWTDIVHPDYPPGFIYVTGEYFFDLNTINFDGLKGLDSNFSEPNDTSRLSTFQVTYDYKLKSSNTLVLNPGQ